MMNDDELSCLCLRFGVSNFFLFPIAAQGRNGSGLCRQNMSSLHSNRLSVRESHQMSNQEGYWTHSMAST